MTISTGEAAVAMLLFLLLATLDAALSNALESALGWLGVRVP